MVSLKFMVLPLLRQWDAVSGPAGRVHSIMFFTLSMKSATWLQMHNTHVEKDEQIYLFIIYLLIFRYVESVQSKDKIE